MKFDKMKPKILLPICVFLLFLNIIAGVTLALILATTQSIDNYFKLAIVDTQLKEEVDQDGEITLKENVYIKNTGEASVYVRVYLILEVLNTKGEIIANPTFYDEKGNVLNLSLSIDDLMLTTGLNTTDWLFVDGVYYYKKILEANESTSLLFESMELKENIFLYNVNDEDIIDLTELPSISISVLSEAIQVNAIKDVWGVSLDSLLYITDSEGGNE
ncbi:MAG: hypothetical protein R3Y57_05460 [Erysipelotrichaceae bacterium]